MGMTWEQFWEQDCFLVKAYRKAWEIRQEHENQMAWLYGMYIYDALNSTPIIVSGFAKGNQQHRKTYPEKPYELGITKKKKSPAEMEKERKQEALEKMKAFAERFNENFRKKREEAEKKKNESTALSSANSVTAP